MNPTGAAYLMTGLLFLVVPGLIYNNMNSSGLVNTSTSMTCATDGEPICQLSANVGCQVSPGNCALASSTLSFFNAKSPFTQVLQGNIFALFTNLNGPNYQGPGAASTLTGGHGPFDVASGGNFVQANCFGHNGTASLEQINWQPTGCTMTYSDNKNVSLADAQTVNNWNTQQSLVSATTPFHVWTGNASGFVFGCNWLTQINYTALSNGPGFTYFGCDLVKGGGTGIIVDPIWSVLLAFPVQKGAMPAGNSHQYFYAQLENWDTLDCVSAQHTTSVSVFNSVPCQAFVNSFKGIALPGCQATSTCVSFVPGGGGPLVGFLAGLVLFVGGLGLQFGFGGGVSLGINPQGTKLMQVMGLGLILWTFLFSEFALWFTSGFLPYGMDGLFGVVSIVISGLIFGGFYLLAQTGGSTTST